MKRYSIRWAGIITRDVGWTEIEARSSDEAREKFLTDHGATRRVRDVFEIVEPGVDLRDDLSIDLSFV